MYFSKSNGNPIKHTLTTYVKYTYLSGDKCVENNGDQSDIFHRLCVVFIYNIDQTKK